jgi:hypothetical protein
LKDGILRDLLYENNSCWYPKIHYLQRLSNSGKQCGLACLGGL